MFIVSVVPTKAHCNERTFALVSGSTSHIRDMAQYSQQSSGRGYPYKVKSGFSRKLLYPGVVQVVRSSGRGESDNGPSFRGVKEKGLYSFARDAVEARNDYSMAQKVQGAGKMLRLEVKCSGGRVEDALLLSGAFSNRRSAVPRLQGCTEYSRADHTQ